MYHLPHWQFKFHYHIPFDTYNSYPLPKVISPPDVQPSLVLWQYSLNSLHYGNIDVTIIYCDCVTIGVFDWPAGKKVNIIWAIVESIIESFLNSSILKVEGEAGFKSIKEVDK